MSVICFIDLETTGLTRTRRPWEIAIIRREPGEPDKSLLIQITDVDLSDAEPEALKISRFYERHVDHAPEPVRHMRIDPDGATAIVAGDFVPGTLFAMSEAYAAVLVTAWLAGAHVFGVVPSFDARTLDDMFGRAQLPVSWQYRLDDVENHAAGMLRAELAFLKYMEETVAGPLRETMQLPEVDAPGCKPRIRVLEEALALPRRSDRTSRACNVTPPDDERRHTAMGDAEWVRDWWDTIAERQWWLNWQHVEVPADV